MSIEEMPVTRQPVDFEQIYKIQKLHLYIADQGWGELKRQLGYKLLWHGGLPVLGPA